MYRSLLALVLLLAAVPAASAACSEQDLQAKAIQLSDLVKAIVAKSPDSADSWKQKQIDVDRLAQSTTDIDQICAAYDKAIADAQAAK